MLGVVRIRVGRASRQTAPDWRHALTKSTKPTPPEIQVVHHSYQPSKAELEADLRLKGTFKAAVKALLRPVRVRQVMPPKPK